MFFISSVFSLYYLTLALATLYPGVLIKQLRIELRQRGWREEECEEERRVRKKRERNSGKERSRKESGKEK